MTKFGDPQNWISVCVSIGVLLVVSAVALVYFCARRSSTPVVAAPGRRHDDDDDVEIGGIDESTLDAYPTVTYREARKQRQAAAEGCTVCLERYGDGDVVRVLPDCGHLFHRECVDPWLRKRSTCPVCRTSPLPSPMPTPLAEVTPLALARPS